MVGKVSDSGDLGFDNNGKPVKRIGIDADTMERIIKTARKMSDDYGFEITYEPPDDAGE